MTERGCGLLMGMLADGLLGEELTLTESEAMTLARASGSLTRQERERLTDAARKGRLSEDGTTVTLDLALDLRDSCLRLLGR